MEESVRKDLTIAKALSIFEGAVFFVAGVCTLLADGILGYISGGMLIILGCINMLPVFIGGDDYFVNLGMSLVKDENAAEYAERVAKEEEDE